MPDQITRVGFRPDLLPEVSNFDCGTNAWEVAVSTWIKGTDPGNSVLSDIVNWGTRVWLYYNAAGVLVGFGSLGTNAWTIESKRVKVPVSIIPVLGVDRRFH